MPHRCSGRLDDLVTALLQSEFRPELGYRWRLFATCLASKPGMHPRDPYINDAKNPERPYDIVDQKEQFEARRRAQLGSAHAAAAGRAAGGHQT